MSLYVQETYINATEGYSFGESDVYETYFDTTGDLYRNCVREFGRCVGKVYVDPVDGGPPLQRGWVFQGRRRYEDTNEPYLREVWVMVHDAPPTVTREYHPHVFT